MSSCVDVIKLLCEDRPSIRSFVGDLTGLGGTQTHLKPISQSQSRRKGLETSPIFFQSSWYFCPVCYTKNQPSAMQHNFDLSSYRRCAQVEALSCRCSGLAKPEEPAHVHKLLLWLCMMFSSLGAVNFFQTTIPQDQNPSTTLMKKVCRLVFYTLENISVHGFIVKH